MPNFGMRIINDFGSNLIDIYSSNLAFKYKGVAQTISPPPGANFGSVTAEFDVSTQFPVVALYLAGYACSIRSQRRIDAWTWRLQLCSNGPVGQNIEFFVFDIASNVAIPGGQNFGMRTWDGAGKLLFDHSQGAPPMPEMLELADYSNQSLVWYPGRKIAFATGRFKGRRDPQGPGQPVVIWAWGAQAIDGGIIPRSIDTNYALAAGNVMSFAGSSAWIMDVTAF